VGEHHRERIEGSSPPLSVSGRGNSAAAKRKGIGSSRKFVSAEGKENKLYGKKIRTVPSGLAGEDHLKLRESRERRTYWGKKLWPKKKGFSKFAKASNPERKVISFPPQRRSGILRPLGGVTEGTEGEGSREDRPRTGKSSRKRVYLEKGRTSPRTCVHFLREPLRTGKVGDGTARRQHEDHFSRAKRWSKER